MFIITMCSNAFTTWQDLVDDAEAAVNLFSVLVALTEPFTYFS